MRSGTELMSRTTSAGDISSSRSMSSEYVAFEVMAQAQVACDKCGATLVPNAAYCERCGERTRRARPLFRFAIRVQVRLFLMVVALVIGIKWLHQAQPLANAPD